MDLIKLPAHQLAQLIATREVTSLEVTKAFLKQVRKCDNLNAYITVTEEVAIEQAQLADIRIKEGKINSKLDGVPIAIKDNFLTKGIRTTNASKFYSNFIPPYESTITQKLRDAGLVCIGKTNMDEFAMGSDNTTSYFGPVVNPWRYNDQADKVPGGSSGGSAAAVAARTVPLSLGTDTGGSIRQPASFCGLVGLKPTYGLCSRYGIFSFGSSLDQAGTLSSNVLDNALLLEIISGYDSCDTTMMNKNYSRDYTSNIKESNRVVKVGIIKEYDNFPINEEVQDAYNETIKLLKAKGISIKYVSFPLAEYVLPVYYIIAPVEAMSNFSRFDGIRYGERADGENLFDIYQNSRGEGFSTEVKSRILMGTYNVLKENFDIYIKACKVRTLIAQSFKNILNEVDFILTPTTSNPAFDIGKYKGLHPLEMYFNDIFTVGINLAGLPALSLPYGLTKEGLPIGMQIIGNYFLEKELYNFVYYLEQMFDFKFLPNCV